jgi:hypothetical protein
MREHRSCASREGATFATVDLVAAEHSRRPDSTKVLESVDRQIQAATQEWTGMLDDARRADPEALRALLCELEDGPLPEHRTQVIEASLSCLESMDTLRSTLLAQRSTNHSLESCEHRIARNDFDALKARYLDIFELAFQSVVFVARVANIVLRGNAGWHACGYHASLRQALWHSKTRDREHWLIEFPAANQLYGRLRRATRNDIGHGRLHYDHRRGQILYGNGRRGSYLEFLVDYLNAVRLTQYLINVIIGLRRTAGALEDQCALTMRLHGFRAPSMEGR